MAIFVGPFADFAQAKPLLSLVGRQEVVLANFLDDKEADLFGRLTASAHLAGTRSEFQTLGAESVDGAGASAFFALHLLLHDSTAVAYTTTSLNASLSSAQRGLQNSSPGSFTGKKHVAHLYSTSMVLALMGGPHVGIDERD